MVTNRELTKRLNEIDDVGKRVSDYIVKKMVVFLQDSEDEGIRNIIDSSPSPVPKIKPNDSVVRKARATGVENSEEIPELIDDYLRTRIATPYKDQAQALFEYLQRSYKKDEDWFCSVCDVPQFTPYTIDHGNRYSISTGYQAYHISFVYDSADRHKSECDVTRWPFELQIMSQLWEFWAEYSHKYFYRSSATPRVPYQRHISRLLDAADDFMRDAAESMLSVQEHMVEEPISMEETVSRVTDLVSVDREEEELARIESEEVKTVARSVAEWLEEENRLLEYFGTTQMPNELFLMKIQQACDAHSVTLDSLESILDNENYKGRYRFILAATPRLDYLPPYQMLLTFLLMNAGRTDSEVVEWVNRELVLLGKRLRVPPQPGEKTGTILWYNEIRHFGIVESEGNTYKFFQESFDEFLHREEEAALEGATVSFIPMFEDSPKYGANYIARHMVRL